MLDLTNFLTFYFFLCKDHFVYRGVQIWNELPEGIKKCGNKIQFKQLLKKHIKKIVCHIVIEEIKAVEVGLNNTMYGYKIVLLKIIRDNWM